MNGRVFFTVQGKIKYIDPVTAHGKLWRNIVLTDVHNLHTTQDFDKTDRVREGDSIIAECFVDIPMEREGQTYVSCYSARITGTTLMPTENTLEER